MALATDWWKSCSEWRGFLHPPYVVSTPRGRTFSSLFIRSDTPCALLFFLSVLIGHRCPVRRIAWVSCNFRARRARMRCAAVSRYKSSAKSDTYYSNKKHAFVKFVLFPGIHLLSPDFNDVDRAFFCSRSLESHNWNCRLKSRSSATAQSPTAAMLFLSSRSLCLLCNSNLSIAYCNLSFLRCRLFISNILASLSGAADCAELPGRRGCALVPKLEVLRLLFSLPSSNSDRAFRLSSLRSS